ncbi:MAG: hypothetical protein GY874_15255 [Desulfobacteraceae bacterium]|nr:hypothetical protein [Desulfobacteraceae bacterium]
MAFGPWVGIGAQISIAGVALLKAEYDLLQMTNEKAGPIIRAVMEKGQAVLCVNFQ